MNRTKIKNYAPQARRDFIQAVTDRAAFYGLTPRRSSRSCERGDVAIIAGGRSPGGRRQAEALEERVKRDGFEQTMEALAYTWFNRLVAIRYMELHGYLDHGYRVLSHPTRTKTTPEILDHAEHVDLPGLKRETVIELKLDGNEGGRALPDAADRPVQRSAHGHAVPVRADRRRDGTGPAREPAPLRLDRPQARRRDRRGGLAGGRDHRLALPVLHLGAEGRK